MAQGMTCRNLKRSQENRFVVYSPVLSTRKYRCHLLSFHILLSSVKNTDWKFLCLGCCMAGILCGSFWNISNPFAFKKRCHGTWLLGHSNQRGFFVVCLFVFGLSLALFLDHGSVLDTSLSSEVVLLGPWDSRFSWHCVSRQSSLSFWLLSGSKDSGLDLQKGWSSSRVTHICCRFWFPTHHRAGRVPRESLSRRGCACRARNQGCGDWPPAPC